MAWDRLAAGVVLFDCLRTCLGAGCTVPYRSHMGSQKAEAPFIEQTKTVMVKIRQDDWQPLNPWVVRPHLEHLEHSNLMSPAKYIK